MEDGKEFPIQYFPDNQEDFLDYDQDPRAKSGA
jgi:hypothetical protein